MTSVSVKTRSGALATLSSEAVDALRGRLRGPLCLPGEPGYEQARTVWNAMIDRRPGIVVRAAGANDVIRAVAFARRNGLRLAVPGGDGRRHLPLMVAVADNGGGIPEDLKPHLFDPFVTTKRKGTGLGLALVAKVIGDHGGVIEFDSQPRRTVFRVFLPLFTPAEVAQDGNG